MISIVANFYKSERYIPSLVKSVLAQTYTDWELICVNDCSPGRDSEILHRYAHGDNRIRVVDNPVNLGISRAKKTGIDAALGEYITFIDGDDHFAKDALQRMHQAMTAYDVDVVAMQSCKYMPILHTRQVLNHGVCRDMYERRVENPELFDECFVNFFGFYRFNVAYWGKLYRTEILKNLDFDYPDAKHTAGEDYKFSLAVFRSISSMAFIDYVGYYWRWGGITTGKKNNEWAPYKFVVTHQDFYGERKQLLDTYHYEKGYKWLQIELKNVIIAGVCRILESADDAEAEKLVSDILSHPSTADVGLLLGSEPYIHQPIVHAVAERDTATLIRLCRQSNAKHRLRRVLKNMTLQIISAFA